MNQNSGSSSGLIKPSKPLKAFLNKILGWIGLELQEISPVTKDLSTTSTKRTLSAKFRNYHLGCGTIIAGEFLNIDGSIADFSDEVGVPVLVQGSQDS